VFDSPENPNGREPVLDGVCADSSSNASGFSIPSSSYHEATASSSPGTSVGSGLVSSSSRVKSTKSRLPHAGQAEPPKERRPQTLHSNMAFPDVYHEPMALQYNGEMCSSFFGTLDSLDEIYCSFCDVS
jgi:hypothetical protein